MKKYARRLLFYASALILLSAHLLTGCGPVYIESESDFYGEVKFEPPFDRVVLPYTGRVRFSTNKTLEEMCRAINESYAENACKAVICESDGERFIWITKMEDSCAHYFMIVSDDTDHMYEEENDGSFRPDYLIDTPTVSLSHKEEDEKGRNSSLVLVPRDLIGLGDPDESGRIKINGTFDDLLSFYKSTGKSDCSVDEEEKLIVFRSKVPRDGTVFIRYIEEEDGNFIVFKLIEDISPSE